jgi:hypothetical protein
MVTASNNKTVAIRFGTWSSDIPLLAIGAIKTFCSSKETGEAEVFCWISYYLSTVSAL